MNETSWLHLPPSNLCIPVQLSISAFSQIQDIDGIRG